MLPYRRRDAWHYVVTGTRHEVSVPSIPFDIREEECQSVICHR